MFLTPLQVEPHPLRLRRLITDEVQTDTYCALMGIQNPLRRSGAYGIITGDDISKIVNQSIDTMRMIAL